MERSDFYKNRIDEISKLIMEAESKKDFKQMIKLQVEKLELEKRMHE